MDAPVFSVAVWGLGFGVVVGLGASENKNQINITKMKHFSILIHNTETIMGRKINFFGCVSNIHFKVIHVIISKQNHILLWQ